MIIYENFIAIYIQYAKIKNRLFKMLILHLCELSITNSGINETKQHELELVVSCLHNHSASL